MQLNDQKIIELGLDSSGIDESDLPGAPERRRSHVLQRITLSKRNAWHPSREAAPTHASVLDRQARFPEAAIRRSSGRFARRPLARCAPSHRVFDGGCLRQPE